MTEGKELLIDIVSSYQDKVSQIEDKKIIVCDIDVVEAYNKLKDDKFYLSELPIEFINQIIIDNKYQKHIIFKKKLYQLRDLYLGQKGYGINIKDKEDYHKTLSTFISLLDNIIESGSNVEKKELIKRIDNLISGIKYNEVINDYELIELMSKDYNNIEFDRNMFIIMEYISKHNYNILNDKSLSKTLSITKDIKVSEIDEELKGILKYLNINYNELPIDYKISLKDTNKDKIIEVFNLIKHNRAEDYGILHLINKHNAIDKLALLLYSDVDSIKECVEVFRDNNGDIDIKTIKYLIHSLLSVFINNDNPYYGSLHTNFMNNILLFNELNINISNLIYKCPLLFVVPNENIKEIIEVFGKYNIDGKKVINKLYKVIAYNYGILSNNIDILSKYFDIEEYLNGNNYNLLKIVDLEKKINFIINKYETNESELILKYLIKEIYDNSDRNIWGDINA